jgi:hypothetical protein
MDEWMMNDCFNYLFIMDDCMTTKIPGGIVDDVHFGE